MPPGMGQSVPYKRLVPLEPSFPYAVLCQLVNFILDGMLFLLDITLLLDLLPQEAIVDGLYVCKIIIGYY